MNHMASKAVLSNSGEWKLILNFQQCEQFRAKEGSQALIVKAELPQKSWEQQPQPACSDDPAKHKVVTRRDCILLWFFSAQTTLETLTSCWYSKGEIHFHYMLYISTICFSVCGSLSTSYAWITSCDDHFRMKASVCPPKFEMTDLSSLILHHLKLPPFMAHLLDSYKWEKKEKRNKEKLWNPCCR